ncbi:MAG: type II toxin-antitoxin system PemK/MazF family toxin [Saprospiraceae bacterium]
MNWSRFEIWYADLNPKFGTEAGKVRPVLIIQTDLLEKHPSTLICPITSKTKKGVSILRVNLDKGEGGLTMDSAIMIDQLRAIDNKRLVEYIGQLPK